jgi:hypothetical protein
MQLMQLMQLHASTASVAATLASSSCECGCMVCDQQLQLTWLKLAGSLLPLLASSPMAT